MSVALVLDGGRPDAEPIPVATEAAGFEANGHAPQVERVQRLVAALARIRCEDGETAWVG